MEIIQRTGSSEHHGCRRRGSAKPMIHFFGVATWGCGRLGRFKGVEMRTERKRYIHVERTPLFPELTTYWARHTWATIAAELDIPKKQSRQPWGHSLGDVTDIYIQFNRKKIDKANRKVLDYLNPASKNILHSVVFNFKQSKMHQLHK